MVCWQRRNAARASAVPNVFGKMFSRMGLWERSEIYINDPEACGKAVAQGDTRLMLAGELALAGVDVAVLERRPNQELSGARALGISSRTMEVLDQRGVAGRFLSAGQTTQVAGFATTRLDISGSATARRGG